MLQNMFAELKPYDIEYALKKADGDFQVALDDLLNIQYLQSTGQQMKGVDGFFVADSATKPNKRKTKKKKKKNGKRVISSDLDLSSDGTSSPRISLEGNGMTFPPMQPPPPPFLRRLRTDAAQAKMMWNTSQKDLAYDQMKWRPSTTNAKAPRGPRW